VIHAQFSHNSASSASTALLLPHSMKIVESYFINSLEPMLALSQGVFFGIGLVGKISCL